MRKINAFTFITLNGYFSGPQGDLSWHSHAGEEAEYGKEGLSADNILLFGRVTYDMMSGYWPTPMALEQNPDMAKGMNASEKIVFSNTLKKATWQNTSIVKGDIVKEITMMKSTPGKDMTILGSGSIVALFSDHGLIDSYQIMIDPVALTGGKTIFNGITKDLHLRHVETRTFKSGVVLLTYRPA